jgi:hypothetical protein
LQIIKVTKGKHFSIFNLGSAKNLSLKKYIYFIDGPIKEAHCKGKKHCMHLAPLTNKYDSHNTHYIPHNIVLGNMLENTLGS